MSRLPQGPQSRQGVASLCLHPSWVGGEGGLGAASCPTARSPVERSVSRTRPSPQVHGPLIKDPVGTRRAGARTPALPLAADVGPTSFSGLETITALPHRVCGATDGSVFVTALHVVDFHERLTEVAFWNPVLGQSRRLPGRARAKGGAEELSVTHGPQDRPRCPFPEKPDLVLPVVRGSLQEGSRLSRLAKHGCLAGRGGRSQGLDTQRLRRCERGRVGRPCRGKAQEPPAGLHGGVLL